MPSPAERGPDASAELMRQRLSYLRDCYRLSVETSGFTDVFASRIVRRLLSTGQRDQLLDDHSAMQALPDKAGRKLLQDAYLYRQERSLLHVSLLVTGPLLQDRLAAPLIYGPVRAVDDQHHPIVEIVPDERSINLRLLELLCPDDDEQVDRCFQRLGRLLESPSDSLPAEIAGLLKELNGDIDISALSPVIKPLSSEADIKQAKAGNTLRLLPAAGIVLMQRPTETRGIKVELNKLCDMQEWSAALQQFVAGHCLDADEVLPPPTEPLIPADLSEAQRHILHSAAHRSLTQVIGPPGTGKTFTIACLALDALQRDETVLIACRQDATADVVVDHIQALVGSRRCLLRTGRKHYYSDMTTYLDDLLSGIGLEETEFDANHYRRDIKILDRTLHKAQLRFEAHIGHEVKRGLAEAGHGLWPRLRAWWYSQLQKPYQAQQGALTKELDHIEGLIHKRQELVGQFLHCLVTERLRDLLTRHRSMLQNFSKSLRARTGHKQEDYLKSVDMDLVLKAFPIVVTTASSLAQTIPLQTSGFSVAIIDEASQCDLGSMLPVLQRSQRAVIVGDPKQLRHVSFLAEQQLLRLASQASDGVSSAGAALVDELHYRKRSLLDRCGEVIGNQAAVIMLTEHYRSLPEIIAFSNQRFYRDRLRLMRSHPAAWNANTVQVHKVEGQRNDKGRNSVEAAALVERLQTIIANQADQDSGDSIAVVAPFRDQADELEKQIQQAELDEALVKHRLLVGTPYALQGNERDIVLISLALHDTKAHSALRHLQQDEVFNVMITRARNRQEIFHSLDISSLPNGILRDYLNYAAQDHREAEAAEDSHDHAIASIATCLTQQGWTCYTHVSVAGMDLDLLIDRQGQTVGIDVVGQAGEHGDSLDLNRYRILNRSGLRVVPMAWSAWQTATQTCIDLVTQASQA